MGHWTWRGGRAGCWPGQAFFLSCRSQWLPLGLGRLGLLDVIGGSRLTMRVVARGQTATATATANGVWGPLRRWRDRRVQRPCTRNRAAAARPGKGGRGRRRKNKKSVQRRRLRADPNFAPLAACVCDLCSLAVGCEGPWRNKRTKERVKESEGGCKVKLNIRRPLRIQGRS